MCNCSLLRHFVKFRWRFVFPNGLDLKLYLGLRLEETPKLS